MNKFLETELLGMGTKRETIIKLRIQNDACVIDIDDIQFQTEFYKDI